MALNIEVSIVPPNEIALKKDDLYHYCGLKTAIECILKDKQLLIGLMSRSNDPRENKSFEFGATYWGNKNIVGDLTERNKQISEILRDDCKMICFSQNHMSHFGFELSQMWAYYADNHKGICLKLDRQAFLEENKGKIDVGLLRNINYAKLDLSIPKSRGFIDYSLMKDIGRKKYLREEFRPNHLEELYFTKNEEWEREREVRLVHFSSSRKDEYCSIRNSLKSIILGVDFHNSYIPSIKAVSPNIEIVKLEYKGARLVQFHTF